MSNTKQCATCDSSPRRGKSSYCGPCANAQSRRYYHKTQKFDLVRVEYRKSWNRQNHQKYHMARYGLTVEQREQMEIAQNGLCAICLNDRKLSVDHDHKTGAVRGLLCQKCNAAIGFLEDSNDALQRAIEYLNAGGQF